MDRAARKRAARGNHPKLSILMWSNAAWAQTGYGTQTAQLTTRLSADGHHIAVSANYGLEAAATEWNDIPHYPKGFDSFSTDCVHANFKDWTGRNPGGAPLLLTLYDVWVMTNPAFDAMPLAAWVPIDHMPIPPAVEAFCRKPNVTPIAMSRFGADELAKRGIAHEYAPHGIDCSVFKPTPSIRQEDGKVITGRRIMDLPEDGVFVVSIVNANKGAGNVNRKAFAEQLLAFSIFATRHDDARLYLHTERYGSMGGNQLDPIIKAVGLDDHQYRFINQYQLRQGMQDQALAAVYSASNVLLAATYGEGFGITVAEAQACGTRVITSKFTAQPELVGDGWTVDGQPWWDASQQAWWSIPSVSSMVDALEEAYAAPREPSQKAIDFVRDNYDADSVYDQHWRPILERLSQPQATTPDTWDNGKPAGSLLSIYIPTKGRPELAALLHSLKPQLDTRVEVIVSDNTGAAGPLVHQILGNDCRVEYSKRAHDIGGDANIMRGFTAGTAPWLWIIGDDDEVTTGAIDAICEAIRSSTRDRLVLLSKASPSTAADARGTMAEIAEADPALPMAATLISANVVRRSACDLVKATMKADTKYGHAYAWPAQCHVLPTPHLARVGFAHAGEGIPAGWNGEAIKSDYLRDLGIDPSPQHYGWNYMSAQASKEA